MTEQDKLQVVSNIERLTQWIANAETELENIVTKESDIKFDIQIKHPHYDRNTTHVARHRLSIDAQRKLDRYMTRIFREEISSAKRKRIELLEQLK
jgi:hypothetical protein